MNQFMDMTRLPLEHDEDEMLYANSFEQLIARWVSNVHRAASARRLTVSIDFHDQMSKQLEEARSKVVSLYNYLEDVDEIVHPPAPKNGPFSDPFSKLGGVSSRTKHSTKHRRR